jgi:two-component system response regulator DegU
MRSPVRVAIIDDHAVFRQCIRRLIERAADLAVVAEAENGLAAIDVVDTHRPDVVLMDLNMPLMDGFEATRVITAKHPRTRVVALSMHSDDGIRVRAFESGACHFLSKDCRPAGILTVIRNVAEVASEGPPRPETPVPSDPGGSR